MRFIFESNCIFIPNFKLMLIRSILFVWFSLVSFGLLSAQPAKPSTKAGQKDSLQIVSLIDKSWEYNRSDPAGSLTYARKALELSRDIDDPLLTALSMNAMGVVYYYVSDYEEALDFFFRTLKLYKEQNDMRRMISTYTNIGNCYEKMRAPEEALKYQQEALALLKNTDLRSLHASVLNNIGSIYMQQEYYSKALGFHLRSLAMKKALNELSYIGFSYQNIGIGYQRTGNYQKSISYLDSAMTIFRQSNNLVDQANVLIELGLVASELNQPARAISLLDSAIALSEETDNLNSKILALQNLSSVYEKMEDPGRSLAYHKVYSLLKDSLAAINREQKIMQLNALYEIEQQNEQLQQLQQTVAHESKLKTVAIVLAICIGIMLLLTFYYIRLRAIHQKQKDQILMLENEKQARNLEMKNVALMTNQLQQLQKKELLEKIKGRLDDLSGKTGISEKKLKDLKNLVKDNLRFDAGWEQFKLHFENVHPAFFSDLEEAFPTLTSNEKRLCAYMKLNLSAKEIARLLGVSDKSVHMARYRMKKKMAVSAETDLHEVIRHMGPVPEPNH